MSHKTFTKVNEDQTSDMDRSE